MKKLICKTPSGQSDLFINRDWEEVGAIVTVKQTIIITDSNISGIYSESFPDCKVLCLSPGEQTKNLSTIDQLINELLKLEVDRSYFLLGIGGGVVCDITGFIASIYMRGLDFGLVSTSLLSQVDASTGGKNGVNRSTYKNVIGCYKQPRFVFCDTRMLKTLPEEEFRSGLAEIVKHAIIRDTRLFDLLEREASNINPGNKELMDELIERSLAIKISIVEKDEKELGERRLLNFGHTIGHAIESAGGQKHGFAVAMGMYFSSMLSFEEGKLSSDKFDRIVKLLYDLRLMSENPQIARSYIDIIKRDKKRERDAIHFVLLNDLGEANVELIPLETLVIWMEKKIKDES